MKKQKNSPLNQTPMYVWLLTTGFCVFIVLKLGNKLTPDNTPLLSVVFKVISTFFIYYISVFIQKLIMVTGHMIFGLLSGYSFVSFRIYSLLWAKENGKIKLNHKSQKKNAIAVFLLPPETKSGSYLAAPYILGGGIANLLSSGFFLLFFILTYNIKFLPVLMLFCSVIGSYSAVVQLLPFGYEYNNFQQAYIIKKNPDALRLYDNYMKIGSNLSNGIRLKDMPDNWFEMTEVNSLNNHIFAANAVVICDRYIDSHQFGRVTELTNNILEADNIIYEFALRSLISNKIYCDILLGNSEEVLKHMTAEQLKFMNSKPNDISFLRTKYAYTLICENNPLKADEIKAKFERACSVHLYTAEAQMEQELVEIADKFILNKA